MIVMYWTKRGLRFGQVLGHLVSTCQIMGYLIVCINECKLYFVISNGKNIRNDLNSIVHRAYIGIEK